MCTIYKQRNPFWYNANDRRSRKYSTDRYWNGKFKYHNADSSFLLHFQIQAAANLLLESKMFYVPFVLNSAEIR